MRYQDSPVVSGEVDEYGGGICSVFSVISLDKGNEVNITE